MTMKAWNGKTRKYAVLALLVVAGTTLFASGLRALASNDSLSLLPLPPLSPLPLPLPPLPSGLTLAPPEVPTIPSLPQVLPSNAPTTSGSTELPVTSATLDAKILIISADGTEPVLGAIRQAVRERDAPFGDYGERSRS